MRAMLMDRVASLRDEPAPLRLAEVPDPVPADGEVLLAVEVCGVCHTEIDEIEGRTPPAALPAILGHEIVGRVIESRSDAASIGDRVGVAWIHSACGECEACRRGDENLCPHFRATGRDAPGGYAERVCVPGDFVHTIPDALSSVEAAPLLCAGAVGARALRLCELEDGEPLGLTGFGASGHLVLRFAQHLYPNSDVHVFARDAVQREFARELGASWAGGTDESPPRPLRAIIDTTPAWRPIVRALAALAPGGRLVVNAIRKEDVDRFALEDLDYAEHLWMEKDLKSVANVTRADARAALRLAAEIPIRPRCEVVPLERANEALAGIRAGGFRGATVLAVGAPG